LTGRVASFSPDQQRFMADFNALIVVGIRGTRRSIYAGQ
jgi:hypothetical protein